MQKRKKEMKGKYYNTIELIGEMGRWGSLEREENPHLG